MNKKGREGTPERHNGNDREEPKFQAEGRISSVSSKVHSTDLKIQDKTQGQNHEKQPDETSQQSREEIREQPEKLRGAERRERAQGKELEVNEGLKSEETNRKYKEREKLQLPHEGELQVEQQVNVNHKEQLEESVSLTGRGVKSEEEKQEEELLEEASDVDRHNIQSRKHTQEIKLQDVCTLPDKKEEIQAGHHQNVNIQNDQFMDVADFAHNQNAATAQLNETFQWAKHQQRLRVQTEPQEFRKENDEDFQDQMEVDEHSKSVSLTERGVDCLEEELMETDQKDDKNRKRSNELKLCEVCTLKEETRNRNFRKQEEQEEQASIRKKNM